MRSTSLDSRPTGRTEIGRKSDGLVGWGILGLGCKNLSDFIA